MTKPFHSEKQIVTFQADVIRLQVHTSWKNCIHLKVIYLPSFVPHTWMKADLVQETGVNAGQGQIWHPTQLNQTIYL